MIPSDMAPAVTFLAGGIGLAAQLDNFVLRLHCLLARKDCIHRRFEAHDASVGIVEALEQGADFQIDNQCQGHDAARKPEKVGAIHQ